MPVLEGFSFGPCGQFGVGQEWGWTLGGFLDGYSEFPVKDKTFMYASCNVPKRKLDDAYMKDIPSQVAICFMLYC